MVQSTQSTIRLPGLVSTVILFLVLSVSVVSANACLTNCFSECANTNINGMSEAALSAFYAQCTALYSSCEGMCGPEDAITCSTNADCNLPLECIAGKCDLPPCSTSADCPQGFTCVDNKCSEQPTNPKRCSSNSDCPLPLTCFLHCSIGGTW